MAGINFGNFVTVGGRTISTGLSSGIDTNSLINALLGARAQPAVALQDRISEADRTAAALGEYGNLLSALRSAANSLRNPPGISQALNNAFEARASFLTSNTDDAAATYLAVNVSAGATLAAYNVEIQNLAEARQIRTADGSSFSSQDSDLTGGGGITAGTFQFLTQFNANERIVQTVSNSLVNYNISGTGAGIFTGGIDSITQGSGDVNLIGTPSNFTATVNGTDVDLSLTINGSTYTTTVAANTGAGSDSIAAGAITFTNAGTGTSFQVTLDSDFVIGASQTNADSFASALTTGLAGVSVQQGRNLRNFDTDALTVFSGLAASNVLYTSDGFSVNTGDGGSFGDFTVTAVSSPGANDGTITVTIDGETFEATGLGDDGSNTETGNIVLNSTTTDKSFAININDAAVTLDFSSATTAQAIEDELDAIFNERVTDVTVDANATLNDVRAAINFANEQTGVTATILKASDSDFRLILTADETGVENSFTLANAGNVFVGDAGDGSTVFDTVQAAENAQFTIDGLSLTRPTNVVEDAVPGVTFALFQETPTGDPNTIIGVEIARDTSRTLNDILAFAAAFNELQFFRARQTAVDSEGVPESGANLVGNTLLRVAQDRIVNEINSEVGGLPSTVLRSLEDIGITFTDSEETNDQPFTRNVLEVDSSKLADALASNFDEVRKVFELSFNASANSKVQVFASPTNLGVNEFSIDIDTNRSVGDQVRITYLDSNNQSVTINADFEASTGTNGTIKGQDGTVLEGLELVYTGDGTDVIDTVTITQGLADLLYQAADTFVKVDGAIDQELASLERIKENANEDIANLDRQLEIFRDSLVERFSRLEAALASVNNTLLFLEAQDQARQAFNG